MTDERDPAWFLSTWRALLQELSQRTRRGQEREVYTMPSDLQTTAELARGYIEEHLFDPDGLMYSYIDVRTGQPFDPEYARAGRNRPDAGPHTPWSIELRPDADPVAYWSYEDSVITAGLYMDGLVLESEATGDAAPLDRAREVWRTYREVYYASQVHGEGAFLRPYGGRAGGFQGLSQWAEPLGTDQASPFLSAQYALLKHASEAEREEIARLILGALGWYERQGFRYLYYKSLIHGWDAEPPYCTPHAGSYYFPACAFAYSQTGHEKWLQHIRSRLPLTTGSGKAFMETFIWGSDVLMLKALLGSEFEALFPRELQARGCAEALNSLSQYDEAGLPAGVDPVQGRSRPYNVVQFLCGLAALGHPGARERAEQALGLWRRVPEDFTFFAFEDREQLPLGRYMQLQACAVGTQLVAWYRNYWRLRCTE